MPPFLNTLSIPLDSYKHKPAMPGRREGGMRVRGVPPPVTDQAKPLVTIVTVVYNNALHLEQTIESVLGQTYSNIEYLIIDGGSTDGTIGIIERYDYRIAYWVSEADNGISDAFNKGIAASHGEIIGILNSDDWYEEDAVACAVEAMGNRGADIVYGMLRTWDSDLKSEEVSADHELLEREMSLNHPAVFATRAAYEKVGLYRTDFRYAMDYEWLLRAKKTGLTFISIDKCLANMRVEGISNVRWREPLKEEARAKSLVNPSISNLLYYYYKNAKGYARRFLEKTGLRFIVRLFHAHISSVRKTRSRI
jgi:glycosyltransferase involved in cell wall biosynthesis